MKKKNTSISITIKTDELLNKLAEITKTSRNRVIEDLVLKESVKLGIEK